MTGEKFNGPILDVDDLSVSFYLPDSVVRAVRSCSFHVDRGRTLGLVGESGCGKSVSAYSIMRLVSPPGIIDSGEVRYRGRDLLGLDNDEMRKMRGAEIAMIFQEPMSSLNPVFRIGYQISESLRLHLGMSPSEARERAVDLLGTVGIPSPAKRYDSYPHEFSGGMRQRVMIAIALSASPSLLIADEPTTALDVTIQAQILDLLVKLQEDRDMSLLLITHDLGIVASVADSIAIMYAGEIVEYGSTSDIFTSPLHPYTRGLFDAVPRIGENRDKLNTIPGVVPAITETPSGCVFYPRCAYGTEECLRGPVSLTEYGGNGHRARCVRAGRL